MSSHTIQLSDSRQLGYALYGPASGQPLLYFHGTPSSRHEPLLLNSYGVELEALLHEAQTRLIAVDRPGMGLSTYNPRGSFLSFAEDVGELLDQSGIRRCPVVCWSGGGPYALALAHRHAERISSVSIICGFTRPFDPEVLRQMGMNRWYFRFARYTPWLLRTSLGVIKRRKIRYAPPRHITGLSHVDYNMMKDIPHLRVIAECTLKEACSRGGRGAVHEARNYFNEFGFPLSAIRQPVHYWWGTQDMTVIRLHAEAVEQQAPNAIMHYRPGEGHLSLYVRHFKDVLQTISEEEGSRESLAGSL